MREERDKNFWSEFFKWFLIWNFVGLIFKGIFYVCKLIILAIKQLIWLIYLGIKKITPIIQKKASEFYNKFNTTYKPIIITKFTQLKNCMKKLRDKLIYKIKLWLSKLKKLLDVCYITFLNFLRKLKKKNVIKKEDDENKKGNTKTAKVKNKCKRVKYILLDLYYDYELPIVIGIVLIVIIAIFIIIQRK